MIFEVSSKLFYGQFYDLPACYLHTENDTEKHRHDL